MIKTERHIVSQDNQVLFVLENMPIYENKVEMVVADGGVELVNGRDYIVQGRNVNYTSQYPSFEVGESVVFKYFY